MNKARSYPALAAVGIISWALFILGCVGTVSWSPDSSRILFSYYDSAAHTKGVAVYDLRTRDAKSIFSRPVPANEEDQFGFMAQWQSSGQRAIVAMPDHRAKQYDLFSVPMLSSSQAPEQHFVLPDADDDWGYIPYPEIDGRLYVGTSKYTAIINLQNGAVEIKPPALISLGQAGDRILYVRPKPEPQTGEKQSEIEPKPIEANDAPQPDGSKRPRVIEFGLVETGRFALEHTFELAEADLNERGIDDLRTVMFVEPNGRRFVMLGSKDDRDCIIVFGENGLERAIVPNITAASYTLGNVAWGGSGLLYTTVALPTGKDTAQVSVAEISVSGQVIRLIPVTRINWDSSSRGNFASYVPVSVSPDGRMAAVATAALPEKVVTRDARALYLIDLHDPRRNVTRITFPPMARRD